MNKQNITENEAFKPERRDPDIISVHTDDLILVQDRLMFNKLGTDTNKYYGPFEPDGVNLKYWCRFNHIANGIKDESFSGNLTYPVGSPILVRGPDDGVKGGTIMTEVNHCDKTLTWFYVKDAPGVRVNGLTTGFSIYLAFVIYNTSVISGGVVTYTNRGIKPLGFKIPGIKLSGYTTVGNPSGINVSVAFKVDDIVPSNGWWIRVGPSGELKFFVLRAGIVYNFISPIGKIKLGQLYEICITYTISGNVITMRINNEVQTDSANETPTFPANHNLNLKIATGPETSTPNPNVTDETPIITQTETMQGVMKDLRKYDNLIFTSAQMDSIWDNKLSISPIVFGQIAVAGIAKFNENVYAGGYDVTAFDTTGFDTT